MGWGVCLPGGCIADIKLLVIINQNIYPKTREYSSPLISIMTMLQFESKTVTRLKIYLPSPMISFIYD